MRIKYDFSDLEAFLAVKDTGSFQLAAHRLNLSQPAITRRIQKLEAALDSVLFERTTRAVKPTLAAKRLQARAEAMLDNAHETTAAMRDESVADAHQKNAIVTLAVLPSVAPLFLRDALRIFRAGGNLARVRVLDRAANEVSEAVAQGEADFGVCSIPMLDSATVFEPLFDDEIVLAMQTNHPLATRDGLEWGDLAAQELIVPSQGTGNRLLIDEAVARLRLRFAWTFEVGRSTTALEMVASGIGVALLPKSSVSMLLGGRVTTRPIGRPRIMRPVGLISRVGHRDHHGVTALKSAVLEVLKENEVLPG